MPRPHKPGLAAGRSAAIVAVFLAALAITAGVHAAQPASLRIVGTSPLRLHGVSFRRREAVKIVVRMGTLRRSRLTHADKRGAFTVRFRRVTLDYCATPLTIVARGRLSGTVRARIPLRECAAP